MTTTRRTLITGAPTRRGLVPMPGHDIHDEPVIESAILQDMTIADDRLANGRIERSVLDGLRLVGAEASSLIVRASDLERCDLAAAVMEGSSLIRCRVDGCKLTGATLDRAILRDTSSSTAVPIFSGSSMRSSNTSASSGASCAAHSSTAPQCRARCSTVVISPTSTSRVRTSREATCAEVGSRVSASRRISSAASSSPTTRRCTSQDYLGSWSATIERSRP